MVEEEYLPSVSGVYLTRFDFNVLDPKHRTEVTPNSWSFHERGFVFSGVAGVGFCFQGWLAAQ